MRRKLDLMAAVPMAICSILAAGCDSPDVVGPTLEVSDDDGTGLVVGIELPKSHFVPGEHLAVKVTAQNTTDEPMSILAQTGAPVYVNIWRNTGLGWDTVKRYPQAATMVMSPWELSAGQTRTFTLRLTVEPDWPTGEPLRMTAQLNGRESITPGIIITVAGSSHGAGTCPEPDSPDSSAGIAE